MSTRTLSASGRTLLICADTSSFFLVGGLLDDLRQARLARRLERGGDVGAALRDALRGRALALLAQARVERARVGLAAEAAQRRGIARLPAFVPLRVLVGEVGHALGADGEARHHLGRAAARGGGGSGGRGSRGRSTRLGGGRRGRRGTGRGRTHGALLR